MNQPTLRLEERVGTVERGLLARVRTIAQTKVGYALSALALISMPYLAGCGDNECDNDSDCDSWEQCVQSCETYMRCGEPAERCKRVCAPKDSEELQKSKLSQPGICANYNACCGDSR